MEGSGSNPDVATNQRSGTHKQVPLRSFLRLCCAYALPTKGGGAGMTLHSCPTALQPARDYGSSGLTFGTLSCPPASAIFGTLSGTPESAIFSTSSIDETGIS